MYGSGRVGVAAADVVNNSLSVRIVPPAVRVATTAAPATDAPLWRRRCVGAMRVRWSTPETARGTRLTIGSLKFKKGKERNPTEINEKNRYCATVPGAKVGCTVARRPIAGPQGRRPERRLAYSPTPTKPTKPVP